MWAERSLTRLKYIHKLLFIYNFFPVKLSLNEVSLKPVE